MEPGTEPTEQQAIEVMTPRGQADLEVTDQAVEAAKTRAGN